MAVSTQQVHEVKRILANTKDTEQVFFWLAAETGLRAGELVALRVSDVDLAKLSLEVSKAIWNGEEHNPKTGAGFRSFCISSRLGAHLAAYLANRPEGHLFQTTAGNPWGASNVLERKLNTLLDRLKTPKIDPKLLAKMVGEDRSVEQATRSEKRAASLGSGASVVTNSRYLTTSNWLRGLDLNQRPSGYENEHKTDGTLILCDLAHLCAIGLLSQVFPKALFFPERSKQIVN